MYDEDEDPEFNGGDESFDGDIEVSCPYCGETVPIMVDTAGGVDQEYVEDCPVCCRPWHVHVHIARGGRPEIQLEVEAS